MSSERETGEGRRTSHWEALIHGRTLFTLLLFGIFASMVYVATDYTWPANFLPYVIGIPGMALTLLQVVLDIRGYHAVEGKVDPRTDFERYMDEIAKHTSRTIELDIAKERLEILVDDPSLVARSRNRREAVLFLYFFFLLAVVLLFGFWIGFPIFLAAFLRFYSRESWKLTILLMAGSWIVMYFILAVLLQQILFEGFVTQYVVDNWLSE